MLPEKPTFQGGKERSYLSGSDWTHCTSASRLSPASRGRTEEMCQALQSGECIKAGRLLPCSRVPPDGLQESFNKLLQTLPRGSLDLVVSS